MGLLSPRQRVLFLGFGKFGFAGDFTQRDAYLLEQQLNLRQGELLALGAKAADTEQANLFVFELDDAVQPTVFRLHIGQDWGGVGSG
jgi:hypothetical protein